MNANIEGRTDMSKQVNVFFQNFSEEDKAAITLSDRVWKIRQDFISELPFHINVIEAACHGKFKETGHSRVLADLLRHPNIQHSFLSTFLGITYVDEELDIENIADVTAETDRVDVALKKRKKYL